MLLASDYPLLVFISPYIRILIHISFFLKNTICGQRPLSNFGGQKSLDSFKKLIWRSPTYAKPTYNNSWSPPPTLFFSPPLNFQKKISEMGYLQLHILIWISLNMCKGGLSVLVISRYNTFELVISPFVHNLLHISNLFEWTIGGRWSQSPTLPQPISC